MVPLAAAKHAVCVPGSTCCLPNQQTFPLHRTWQQVSKPISRALIALVGNYVWNVVSVRNQVKKRVAVGNVDTACRWTWCLAMIICVIVFEVGVFAGKSRSLKEDLNYALEDVKKGFQNMPQLEYVKISQSNLAPVIALTQEEPNTHYKNKPEETLKPRDYTILENLEYKMASLLGTVELFKDEIESLKYQYMNRSLESSYAPVITVKFHYYVFVSRKAAKFVECSSENRQFCTCATCQRANLWGGAIGAAFYQRWRHTDVNVPAEAVFADPRLLWNG